MTMNNLLAHSSTNLPLRDVWAINNRLKGLLTCTSISPSGMWLVSGCQGGTILFVDYKAGTLAGILDLESQFYMTAAIWRSDTSLVIGCSSGTVYQLDFDYKSKRPVGMHTLVKSLGSAIRCIAFDTFRDMLAVACAGDVWIYVRSLDNAGVESWDCVDHILAPCVGPPGLVTSLCFFGFAMSCRSLFIGHAKAGWTIWVAPRSHHRKPFVESGSVCTIASATILPNEKFIAIATLDHSLVTYALKEGGPAVETRVETSSREVTAYRPVLPIAATSSDLIVKGTAVGDIELLDFKTRAMVSLQHAPNHIIRTLTAYGDKVVVGSSGLIDDATSSCLRCYTFSNATEPRDWHRIDRLQVPIFEISLSSILPFNERVALRNPLKILAMIKHTRAKFMRRQALGLTLVSLGILMLTLTLDPPHRDSHTSVTGVRPSYSPHPRPLNASHTPALSALLLWGARTLAARVSMWVGWVSQLVVRLAKFTSYGALLTTKGIVMGMVWLWHAFWLVPQLVKQTVFNIPDVLAEFICDVLRSNGSFNDICPA